MYQSAGPYMLPGAYTGDALSMLKALPDGCIHCSVSSPPYFKARVYHPDSPDEIGREDDLSDYIDKMVEVYAEVARALRPDGTIWVNLGDGFDSGSRRLMPHRFAMALEERLGLTLRMDVVMETTSIAPEPVRVRPIPSHQYIFMFTKGSGHYYDPEMAIEPNLDSVNGYRMVTSVWRMPASRVTQDQAAPFHVELPLRCLLLSTPPAVCSTCFAPFRRKVERPMGPDGKPLPSFKEWAKDKSDEIFGKYGKTANRLADRSMGYGSSLSHYFKEVHGGNTTKRLMNGFEPTCRCGDVDSPAQAVVLDPFLGTGTTGAAAASCGRTWIGFDIDPDLADRVSLRMADINTGNVAAAVDMGFSVWEKLLAKAGVKGLVGSEHLPEWPRVFESHATSVDPNYLDHPCDDCGADVNWTCDRTVHEGLMGSVHRSRVTKGQESVSWFRKLVSDEYQTLRDLNYDNPGVGKSPRGAQNEILTDAFRCPTCEGESGEECIWLHDEHEGDEIPRGWSHLSRVLMAKQYAERNR